MAIIEFTTEMAETQLRAGYIHKKDKVDKKFLN